MSRTITTLVVMLLLALPVTGSAAEPRSRCANGKPGGVAVRACVWQAAKRFHQSYAHALACARGESGLNPHAYYGNPWNRLPRTAHVFDNDISAGVYMFKPSTWKATPVGRTHGHHALWSARWSSLAAMQMWAGGQIAQWSAPAC